MRTNHCNRRREDAGTLEEEQVLLLGLLIGKRRLGFAAGESGNLWRQHCLRWALRKKHLDV